MYRGPVDSSDARRASPRPCLKHAPASAPIPVRPSPPPSSRVHFPPTPALSTTFPTHSKSTYDRRPLVVVPNTCALPARGCPGRTYVLERTQSSPPAERDARFLQELPFSPSPRNSVSNPLAPPPPAASAVPALMPDHGRSSSESEESDATIGSPEKGGRLQPQARGMQFLPHAPPEREQEREERRRRRKEAMERARWKTDVRKDDGVLGGF